MWSGFGTLNVKKQASQEDSYQVALTTAVHSKAVIMFLLVHYLSFPIYCGSAIL